jgi:methionine-rich copper-binding protein CopC
MHRSLAAALLALALAAAPALTRNAEAHSGLARSKPAVGSTVKPAPKEVVLWFTEKLELAFSTVDVHDAKGLSVVAGKASVDPAQPTQMRVALKALPPGAYKVIWRVLAVDTHRSHGSFTFHVGW